MTQFSWAQPFSLRRSNRAKKMALCFDSVRGLEVILPRWASEKEGLAFLQSQRAWVEKHRKTHLKPSSDLIWPEQIAFPCVEKTFTVTRIPILSAKCASLSESGGRVLLYGDVEDFKQSAQLLSAWIKEQAKYHLPILFDQVASECQLSYRNVRVRYQKMRWGSCTSNKDINLNDKLILLPADTVRYVMIHELCHTVHLHHKPPFWALVEQYCPDHKKQAHVLRRADEFLPAWL